MCSIPDELGPVDRAYIDKTGRVLTKPEFTYASDFSEGLAAVCKYTKNRYACGYLGLNGKFAIKPQFDWASDFHDGLAAVTVKGKIGYIDKTGRMIIKPRFKEAGDFHSGLAWVLIGDKYGYIDQKGNIRIKPRFGYSFDFSENSLPFESEGRWGYIDTYGRVIIKPKFDDVAGYFSEGLAAVTIGGKDGFIDKKGQMIFSLPSAMLVSVYNSPSVSQEEGFHEGLITFVLVQQLAKTETSDH